MPWPSLAAPTAQIVAVAFVASLVSSTFGFGEALVGVPLFCLSMPIAVATPLAVLISIVISGCVVAQDWRHVHMRSTGWLLVPSIVGIPAGIALLTMPQQAVVKEVLAVLLVAFAGYSLLGLRPPEVGERRRWLVASGLLAGVLGGAFGMNGPPVVVYGAMRRWPPQRFRATLQSYFLPASVAGMAGYWVAGLLDGTVMRDFLECLPAVLAAVWLGRLANRRLPADRFAKLVYAALLVIGGVLFIQTVRPSGP